MKSHISTSQLNVQGDLTFRFTAALSLSGQQKYTYEVYNWWKNILPALNTALNCSKF